ncbi:MAG: response regulator [Oceanidesulfovibrio sp.]
MRILVIDDERPTLEMMELLLGAFGHETLRAETGEEGLEVYAEEQPDVVITDVKMPGMDGIEVLSRIKEMNPFTEVIVVTGHGDLDLAVKALNLNATDFIDKPLQRDALEQALKRAETRLEKSRGEINEIEIEDKDGIAVIKIHGNVTSSTAPYLRSAIDEAASRGFQSAVLAFDRHASINGGGISLLDGIIKNGGSQELKIALAGLAENFRRVLDMVGVTKCTSIHDSVEDALGALSSA